MVMSTAQSKREGLSGIFLEDLNLGTWGKDENNPDNQKGTAANKYGEIKRLEEIKKILSHNIDILPENKKIVLSLYYYDELTIKEIGDVMGLSESQTCQLYTQAILELKKKLTNSLDNTAGEWPVVRAGANIL
jgi:RNA polymerase sigma factor (sigma-70 family)